MEEQSYSMVESTRLLIIGMVENFNRSKQASHSEFQNQIRDWSCPPECNSVLFSFRSLSSLAAFYAWSASSSKLSASIPPFQGISLEDTYNQRVQKECMSKSITPPVDFQLGISRCCADRHTTEHRAQYLSWYFEFLKLARL